MQLIRETDANSKGCRRTFTILRRPASNDWRSETGLSRLACKDWGPDNHPANKHTAHYSRNSQGGLVPSLSCQKLGFSFPISALKLKFASWGRGFDDFSSIDAQKLFQCVKSQ